jgi:HK97 family phage portal protein
VVLKFSNFFKSKKKAFMLSSGAGSIFGDAGRVASVEKYKTNPRVRMAIQPIVNYVASTEWYIERKNEAGDWVEMTSHPFTRMLERGNHILSGHASSKIVIQYVLLEGSCYIGIIRGERTGLPYQYMPFRHSSVTKYKDGGFSATMPDGTHYDFTKEDMFQIIDVDLTNPYSDIGLSSISSLNDEISIDERASKFQLNSLSDSRTPPKMITVDGDFDQSELEVLKQHIYNAAREGGLFVTNMEHSVTDLAPNLVDMPLIDLRKEMRDTILETLNVPKEIVGIIENSNRSTIEAAEYHLIRNVIVPKLEFLRSEWQEKHITPEYGAGYRLRYVSPSSDDKDFSLKAMAAAPNAFKKNEVRELAGFSKVDSIDDDFIRDDDAFKLSEFNILGDEKEIKTSAPAIIKSAGEYFLTPSQILTILNAIDIDAIIDTKNTRAIIEQILIESGQYAINDIASRTAGINFSTTTDGIVAALADTERRIKTIHNLTRNEIAHIISKGMTEAKTRAEIAREIESQYFEKDPKTGRRGVDYRAMRIAMTESSRAANFGAYEGYNQSGLAHYKRWLHNSPLILTGRTKRTPRDHHAAIDGKVIPFNEKFEVVDDKGNVDYALHPQEFSRRENNINCRCTFVATFEKPANSKAMYEKAKQNSRSIEKIARKHVPAMAKAQIEIYRDIVDIVNEKLKGDEIL